MLGLLKARMSHESYAIIFYGGIVERFTAEIVKAQLEKLLKVDVNKSAALLSGNQIVLKQISDRDAAKKCGKPLGADITTTVVKANAATAAPAKPTASVLQKAEPLDFK